MGRSEFLADRGLQIVKKYCVVYWDEKNGWHSELFSTEERAMECGGFGNFTGYSVVDCIIPLGSSHD
jgi:hypothetical protein